MLLLYSLTIIILVYLYLVKAGIRRLTEAIFEDINAVRLIALQLTALGKNVRANIAEYFVIKIGIETELDFETI